MSKKSFVLILILSFVVTFAVSILEAILNPTLTQGGLPFRFGTFKLFGQAGTNMLMLLLDILFWFIVIQGVWFLFKKMKRS